MTPAGLPETTADRPSADDGGLSSVEAATRLAATGPNALPDVPGPSLLVLFLKQFLSPLIYLLLAAALVSVFLGDLEDAAFIAVVLLANGVIGTVQEYSAGRAAAALRELQAPKATVLRDGAPVEIDAREVVPGDLVLLEAGVRVPADLALVAAQDLRSDESLLTGESAPVVKHAGGAGRPDAARTLRAFAGTAITRGRGRGIVTATGLSTEIGRIASQIGAEMPARPPLMVRLERFARMIAVAVGVSVLFLFAVGLLREMAPRDLFLMSVGLAVSAIPEGLPVAISIVLAIGMRRMAGVNVIVRRMAAVESLGSCTMIATDKTGTLTLNELTATEIRLPNGIALSLGPGSRESAGVDGPDGADGRGEAAMLLRAAALPNEARLVADGDGWKGIGDTVDIALLAAARKGGVIREEVHAALPEVGRIPYEPDRRYAASFHRAEEKVRIFVKGAPETLIAMADRMDREGRAVPIDRAALIAQKDEMAARGLRVLAFAEGEIAADANGTYGHHQLVDLKFLGLVGMEDPVRPEVPAAIAACRAAGIGVVMVTGDDPKTACRIAEEAGIAFSPEAVATGEDVAAAEREGPHAIDALTARARIYARVEPVQKLAIVQSLARNGHFVAVTGDGVNDAPALKTADIGVAMGITGTEVTKEAATLVLTDDNFATIVGAVKEGRTIYDNIVKFVRFQLSTNIGAILTVLGAPLFGLATPFTAIQILWINIIMDGPPAMTLGVEPARHGIMEVPPRSSEAAILTGTRLLRLMLFGVLMAAGTLGAYAWGHSHGGHDYAVTLAFTTFVLFQFFNIFNARAEHGSAFNRQFFRNGKLWLALAAVVVLQILVVHWGPAQAIFDTVSLTPQDWALSAAIASSTLLVEEARKWVATWIFGGRQNRAGSD